MSTDSDSGSELASCAMEGQEVEEAHQSDTDEDTESKWAYLPSVVVEKIYTTLTKDGDKYAMSQVCKRWSQQFHCASIWRFRRYSFGTYRTNRNEERAVEFAKRHANHLRCLVISCNHPSWHTCKRFCNTIETFFVTLTRSRNDGCQLKEFDFYGLYAQRYWRYNKLRDKAIASLSHFLCYQRRLEIFSMPVAFLPPANGFRVLAALSKTCGRSLSILNIEDFFHGRMAIFQVPRYKGIIANFRALTSLYVNYSYLSNDLIDTLSLSLDEKFSYLSIKVRKT